MSKEKTLLVIPSINNLDEIVYELRPPVNLTKGNFENLEFIFENNQVSLIHEGIDIKNFSNVWLSSGWKSRDLAFAVKIYLKHFLVPHTFVEKVISKVTDQVNFAMNNIRIPNTFFIDNNDISAYIEKIENLCGYPLIIKDIRGSRGKNSLLINNRHELEANFPTLPKQKKYFFQKFIPNDYDWGVLVSNGKVVSAEKSYRKNGEFRNNAAANATEVFIQLKNVPETVKNIALNAAKILGLSWSRSDIVVDKVTNIPYLMEVNRLPGISSGTNEVIGARNFLEAHMQ
ncbi:MAG TPA: hypothetical protein VGA67_03960 [Candidatus Dojkabacteria bacterium]|jgi:glutathione synthase/RimK-type ligase-like ATP-grasp enzyme